MSDELKTVWSEPSYETAFKPDLLFAVVKAAQDCIIDARASGGEVSFVMGGHRRIRLADALLALKDNGT